MKVILITFFIIIITMITIHSALAQPTSHKVSGYIYNSGGISVETGTNYWVYLTESRLFHGGATQLPFIPNYYTYTFANAINGEAVIVKAWNQTHYGISYGNLVASSPGDVYIDVTLSHLKLYPMPQKVCLSYDVTEKVIDP